MNTPAPHASEPWIGEVDLTFQVVQGCTRPVATYTKAPFKIQRSFHHPESGVCQVILLHTGGGIVGGDRLLSRITLEPNTKVLLTTPAAQKIYRSPELMSQQDIHITLQEQSILEYLPLETIVFNQANYQQKTIVNLSVGSSFVGWDITRLGRTARQEYFETGFWRSVLEVWQKDRNGSTHPLWIDRQQLVDPDRLRSTPFGLNGRSVMGNLLMLGHSVSAAEQSSFLQQWELAGYCPPTFTLTRTMEGLIGRYLGNSSQEARQGFIWLWQQWKRSVLGQSAWVPRLWG